MKKLKVVPHTVSGAEGMPLIIDENGDLSYLIPVDLSTFPDGADRDDARACGWLDISPYWNEPYRLIVENGILRYEPKPN